MTIVDQTEMIVQPRVRRLSRSLMITCVLVAVMAGVAAVWWLNAPDAIGSSPGSLASGVGQLSGLLASLLVCFQLLPISRIPLLERAIGLPRLLKWHRLTGASLLTLIVIHVVLAVIGGMLLDRRTLWSELTTTVIGDREVFKALIGTSLLVAAGSISVRIVRSRLPYEWWYAVHLTIYIAVFLSVGHQLQSGAHFVGRPLMRMLWAELYLATAFVLTIWRVVLPLVGVLRHRVRVERVVPESAAVVSVWVHGLRLDELRVRPGQYFFVRFLAARHLWTAHPYSVSSLPADGRMRFTIGAMGDHSAAAGELRTGTRVILEGPFGTFGFERSEATKVLLIAGGAGVGPIIALAHALCEKGRDVVFIHRSSSADHLPLRDEFATLRLTFMPVLGRRVELGHDPLHAESLSSLVPDIATREAFVCGSAGLVRAAMSALLQLGLRHEQIHCENVNLA